MAFVEIMYPIFFQILPGHLFGLDVHKQHCKDIKHLIHEAIEDHRKSRIVDQPRDFIDAFLDAADTEEDKSAFNEDHLIGVCMDFFEAGGETVGIGTGFLCEYVKNIFHIF